MKPEYKIGNFYLPEGEILAPMAGITDSPYRRLARRFGAGLLYSECISAEGARREGKKTLDLVSFTEEERPIAIQLFGQEPQQFADAAAIVQARFNPDLIDINCGCPVKKFVTKFCGGWLMSDPDLIGRIVEAIKKSVSIPVSVKLRTGYRKPDATAIEAAKAAEEAGASLIALHARYVRGAKNTDAGWEMIGRLKNEIDSVPIAGNGDIFSFSDAKRMVETTGCDRVMIGRWATGRPWIFKHLKDGYPEDSEALYPADAEKIDCLIEHYRLMFDHYRENVKRAVFRMRKYISDYTHGMHGASKLRSDIMTIIEPEEVIGKLRKFQAGLEG